MFNKYILDFESNHFGILASQLDFDDVVNGRIGTVIVDLSNNLIP